MGVVGDWVMEKEGCSEDFGSSDWMTVDPPMGNTMLLGPSTDDVQDLGAGNYSQNFISCLPCSKINKLQLSICRV